MAETPGIDVDELIKRKREVWGRISSWLDEKMEIEKAKKEGNYIAVVKRVEVTSPEEYVLIEIQNKGPIRKCDFIEKYGLGELERLERYRVEGIVTELNPIDAVIFYLKSVLGDVRRKEPEKLVVEKLKRMKNYYRPENLFPSEEYRREILPLIRNIEGISSGLEKMADVGKSAKKQIRKKYKQLEYCLMDMVEVVRKYASAPPEEKYEPSVIDVMQKMEELGVSVNTVLSAGGDQEGLGKLLEDASYLNVIMRIKRKIDDGSEVLDLGDDYRHLVSQTDVEEEGWNDEILIEQLEGIREEYNRLIDSYIHRIKVAGFVENYKGIYNEGDVK